MGSVSKAFSWTMSLGFLSLYLILHDAISKLILSKPADDKRAVISTLFLILFFQGYSHPEAKTLRSQALAWPYTFRLIRPIAVQNNRLDPLQAHSQISRTDKK